MKFLAIIQLAAAQVAPRLDPLRAIIAFDRDPCPLPTLETNGRAPASESIFVARHRAQVVIYLHAVPSLYGRHSMNLKLWIRVSFHA
jgi:hypothetical protein